MIRPATVVGVCLLLGACAGSEPEAIPVPPSGEPAELFGRSPQQVRAEYGAPAFTRRDGRSELWRYDGASCRAFVFFNDQNGRPAVSHVETDPRGIQIAANLDCLKTLRVAAKPVS